MGLLYSDGAEVVVYFGILYIANLPIAWVNKCITCLYMCILIIWVCLLPSTLILINGNGCHIYSWLTRDFVSVNFTALSSRLQREEGQSVFLNFHQKCSIWVTLSIYNTFPTMYFNRSRGNLWLQHHDFTHFHNIQFFINSFSELT